jgi:PIN domain nuclease of toxin-antitoxin system
MLAAQCIAENLVLASKDSAFRNLETIEVVWD